jgi:hypothetical protein
MLTKQELRSIKGFLLQTQPTQGKSMRELVPELNAWQETVKAVERELAAASSAPPDQAE